ncbi:MAG: glutamate-1-semialdehyde 2,1-aminomutase [Planctomycetota bacterium]
MSKSKGSSGGASGTVVEAGSAEQAFAKSIAAHERAKRVMPGGVSSPVRSFAAVGGSPVTVQEGRGCRVTDVDGHAYVDYVMSYGPLILGHTSEAVSAALSKAVGHGWTFGMPTRGETELAEAIVDAVPGVEVVRMVNSGTEAAMSAVRLARGYTGRPKVIKCVGCYHGHVDGLLVDAGSGAASLGTPSSPGVPSAVAAETITVPYNDLGAVKRAFEAYPDQVAAMAVEPVAGNMGLVPPTEGYLRGLRDLCERHGALLLFDEVMSGFRVAYGGAQELYGVTPDLTCLGKVVGGGLPCAAYGGREDVMRHVAPDGPVYQAGTLSGNPLAMAAGLATLEQLRDAELAHYADLEAAGEQLAEGLREAAEKAGCPITVQRVGSMLTVFFPEEAGQPITNYAEAAETSSERFTAFFHGLLRRGVMIPPARFECWFLSTVHDDDAIRSTLLAAQEAFAEAGRA